MAENFSWPNVFILYHGNKIEIVGANQKKKKSFGAAVFLLMAKRLSNQRHKLYFDNFSQYIYVTIQINRFGNPPMLTDNKMIKRSPGCCDELKRRGDWKWIHKNCETILQKNHKSLLPQVSVFKNNVGRSEPASPSDWNLSYLLYVREMDFANGLPVDWFGCSGKLDRELRKPRGGKNGNNGFIAF